MYECPVLSWLLFDQRRSICKIGGPLNPQNETNMMIDSFKTVLISLMFRLIEPFALDSVRISDNTAMHALPLFACIRTVVLRLQNFSDKPPYFVLSLRLSQLGNKTLRTLAFDMK